MDKPRLFHGTRNVQLTELQGDQRFPQTKRIITEHGIQETTGAFVYATHREEQAMLFALPQWPSNSFLMTKDDNPESPLILVLATTEQKFAETEINGAVYGFSGDGFHRVVDKDDKPIREWVKDGAVSLTGDSVTKTAINSLDQILHRKVQVFFLADGVSPDTLMLGSSENILGSGTRTERLEAIVDNPALFVHANKERDIGFISLAKKSGWWRWLPKLRLG